MADPVLLSIEQFFKANLPLLLPTGPMEVLERSVNLENFSAVVLAEDKYESLRLLSTTNYPERGTGTAPPDLCMYRTCDEATYSLAPGEIAHRADFRARTAWAHIISFLQAEIDYPMDSSEEESTPSLERDSPQPSWDSSATEVLRRQHRQFVLAADIRQAQVQFVRWDRAGYVISEAWPTQPNVGVTTILQRRANEDEIELLEDFKQTLGSPCGVARDADRWYLKYANMALENRIEYPIHKIRCDDVPWHEAPATPRTCSYLVGKPFTAPKSPTGRGTKTFAAYSIDAKRLVFLKDTWIADTEGVHPELETYKKLKLHGVKHVATAIAGGYVDNQEIQSQRHMIEKPNQTRQSGRKHYRFITLELGRRLETYTDQKELIQAVDDSLRGHQEAWEDAEILHRDVSAGNIMIDVQTGRGFLTDWDLCKFKDEFGQPDRAGTWPYMSAYLLQYPRKPNELCDDLESFLHVLTIMGLRFHLHTRSASHIDADGVQHLNLHERTSNQNLLALLMDVYYRQIKQGRFTMGGLSKMQCLQCGKPGVRWYGSSPLASLIESMYSTFSERYRNLDERECDYKWGPNEDLLQSPGPSTPQPDVQPRTLSSLTHSDLIGLFDKELHGWSQAPEKTADQFCCARPDVALVASAEKGSESYHLSTDGWSPMQNTEGKSK
ncbi:hypothetical protein EVG20_g8035 [Dentipellis fragilis]|uniref:Fungal-type protein kinase domain-containing protein n=1 Tax=Dentipellis fragilis TaxID=205917 RepID=A0A4Y9Y9P7_9AGAM|nr:hypothetical protein EVG20_g8035 [Dentipellis fragilis]